MLGLARSEAAARAVAASGASARRGDLDDFDGLREAAAASDGVIHRAYNHAAMAAGDFHSAVATDLAAVLIEDIDAGHYFAASAGGGAGAPAAASRCAHSSNGSRLNA